jgi:hypothetical protein
MRRLLAVVVFSLFAVLMVPTMALATHSNGQGPAQDFLSGAAKGPVPLGTACPGQPTVPGHFHTNGQALDNVTNEARGNFWTVLDFTAQAPGNCLGFTSAEFSGSVECVNSYIVPENSSNWVGEVEEVVLQPGNVPGIPGLLFAGMGIVSRHVDESPPTEADRATGFTTSTPLPCNHPLLSNPFNTLPITQGNLITHLGH